MLGVVDPAVLSGSAGSKSYQPEDMMTRHRWIRLILMAVLALSALVRTARAATDLAEEFATPPEAAKPWVNMNWIGRITPADITQHLEELKAKGVGGAMLIDLGAMEGGPYLSDK